MKIKDTRIILEEYKDLARWALKYALNKGCSDVSVNVYTETDNSFEYRDKQLDVLQQSSQNGMSIQLYVDGRFSSYSTNRLDKKDLEWFIINGIKTTRCLEKDEFRRLPDASRLYKGNGKCLDIFDENINVVSIDDKLALIKENINEIYNIDSRLLSISSDYFDSMSGEYMLASNGFEGETATTYFLLSVTTSMKDKGDARPSSNWYSSSIFLKDIQKEGIGKMAYERNLRKLGQEKIKSGVYKMLVDNLTGFRLLSPLISALYGNAVQQKSSFLIDKLGAKIISDKITIIDNPHIYQGYGARWFDAEGVATEKMDVIRNGILKMYYMDTYYAGKLEMKPTIQSSSILTFEQGDENFEQILSSVEKGIWVTGFNGGNTNATTGDFSFGIEGFLIDKGKIVLPLHEMNITGNILTLWQNVERIGNDPRLNTSCRIPSILFDQVCFSGK